MEPSTTWFLSQEQPDPWLRVLLMPVLTQASQRSVAALPFHDLGHHALTELAKSQASDATLMSIVGHVSPRMLAHYSHLRRKAKRSALDSLSMNRPIPSDFGQGTKGYDTNQVTNVMSRSLPMPRVIKSMVELSGIEPLTSSLRTRRSPN